jgi:hypothetical protein
MAMAIALALSTGAMDMEPWPVVLAESEPNASACYSREV